MKIDITTTTVLALFFPGKRAPVLSRLSIPPNMIA
jgi:hypothetical protein